MGDVRIDKSRPSETNVMMAPLIGEKMWQRLERGDSLGTDIKHRAGLLTSVINISYWAGRNRTSGVAEPWIW